MSRPAWLPEVDLRGFTRYADRTESRISVVISNLPVLWIRCGVLSRVEIGAERSRHRIAAKFNMGVTDAEEDSAYAFDIDIVGGRVKDIHNGVVELRAWIAAQPDDQDAIQVPTEPYDLSILPWCERCKGKERHKIAPFAPKPDRALWKHIRGAELVIEMFPVIPEGEQ